MRGRTDRVHTRREPSRSSRDGAARPGGQQRRAARMLYSRPRAGWRDRWNSRRSSGWKSTPSS
ncbi:hypothetical protein trd_1473 [Thermomicrobium roseum DSM 5159]|uniref:Uncharacterized protein n=1 Tax=Thermomicrobium roseum (strain ATCC 27502 / DSM 5159 / P-2) TaxID=309801 RepID=B9KZK3_THERP|nr:hypothetical protein trd_1473 [Thermomicrobium roseum DSM 5159]